MAHEVENMFSVREVPWHGLGKIVTEAPSAEEAIKLAGLDWKVESNQPFYQVDNLGYNNGFKRAKGYQVLTRSDNNEVLSIMKDKYHPLQNDEAFKFFNPFIESGVASFETAGSLKDGKVIWILATLNKAPIDVGGGDFVKKNLLLSNSHDGQMAVRVGFTPIRVVCNNTLTAAHGNSKSQLIRLKHSSRVIKNLSEIQDTVNAIDAKFEATADQFKALARKQINTKDLENYVNIVFELREGGTTREQMRAKAMKETIVKLFETGAGQNLKSAKGTYWGAYNAVTEFLTHESGKNSESRLFSNWFSENQRKNEFAFETAMEAV